MTKFLKDQYYIHIYISPMRFLGFLIILHLNLFSDYIRVRTVLTKTAVDKRRMFHENFLGCQNVSHHSQRQFQFSLRSDFTHNERITSCLAGL